MSEPNKTPRTYAAAAVSFDRLMQESEQMETELAQAQADAAPLREALTESENALRAQRDTSALYHSQLNRLAALARSYHAAVMHSYVAQCDYRGEDNTENANAVSEASCKELDALEAMDGLINQLKSFTTSGSDLLERLRKAEQMNADLLKEIAEKVVQLTDHVPVADQLRTLTAERDALRVALDRAEEGLRGVCIQIGFDPSDGEGTSPEDVVESVKQEIAYLSTKWAGAEDDANTLRAEVATLNAKLADSYPQRYIDGLNSEIRNLRAELAEARKDSERLEWLVEKADIHFFKSLSYYVQEARAAIDAAKGEE